MDPSIQPKNCAKSVHLMPYNYMLIFYIKPLFNVSVFLKFVFFVEFMGYITFIDIYFLILNIVYSKAIAEDVLR